MEKIFSCTSLYLSKRLDLDQNTTKMVLRLGLIYFTELLLLWIVTGSGNENQSLNPLLFKLGKFEFNVMLFQTIGFLVGAICFGWIKGESNEKEKINRIENLKKSLLWYTIGAFSSLVFFFTDKYDYLPYSMVGFALARTITCWGISGGIGINLTIIALIAKKGRHSVPILLFTIFGVLGTILCCVILFFVSSKYSVFIVLGIGTVLGLTQWYKLDPKHFQIAEKKIHTNNYRFKINPKMFWPRVLSFLILGLPTFYLAGILASQADIIVKSWFGEKIDNASSLFLGIQYAGFAFVCTLFCFKNNKFIAFRSLLTTSRKALLICGTIFQAVFILPFWFDISFLAPWNNLIYALIFCSGIGIGINWGILMILIFEQEEFQNAKTFAATLIPNLIRFSLAVILLLPVFLDTKNCFKEGTPDELRMLGFLVYLPYLLILFVFKDEGERKARYFKEDQDLKNSIYDLTSQQKNSAIAEPASMSQLMPQKLQQLKEKLIDKLKSQDFDLINLYFTNPYHKIQGTRLTEQEKQNSRNNAILKIVKYVELKASFSLLNISSDKKLSCIILYRSKSKLDTSLNPEDTYIINLEETAENIIREIETDLKTNFLAEKRATLKEHFAYHQKASEKTKEDYFAYIVRPVVDIENVKSYLVLLKASYLDQEIISALQTLLDLTLLKLSNQATKKLAQNNLNLKAKIRKEQENKLKQQIDIWERLISKNQILLVLESLNQYAKKHNRQGINTETILLMKRWNSLESTTRVDILTYEELNHESNKIVKDLLSLISTLEIPPA